MLLSRRNFLGLLLLGLVLLTGVFHCPAGALAESWKPKVLTGITYKEVNGQKIQLNLGLPMDESGNLRKGAPLMVWLDSGCWYSGKPGNGGIWAKFGVLQRGCAIASVSTRSLATDAFPAQIEDVKAAIRFLRAHADEYGIDKNRIAVSGASSGGHLSNMLAMADDFRLFDVGENLDQSSQANVVVDFYGPTDFPTVLSRHVGTECIYLALGDQKRENRKIEDVTPEMMQAAKKFSPITYVSAKSAPTIILHGAIDPVVPVSQGALYYEALRWNGVRAQIFVTNTGVHKISTLGSDAELFRKIFDFIGWEELKD